MENGKLAAPTGLTYKIEEDTIVLTWNPVESDGLIGYRVYVDGELQNAEPVTAAEYKLGGLARGNTYTAEVSAVYQSAMGDTLAVSLAGRIEGFRAAGGPGSVRLRWDAVPAGGEAVAYAVYVNGAQANAEPISQSEYEVTGLKYGAEYRFEVKALDSGGRPVAASDPVTGSPSHYLAELERWGIRNDGSDPAGTTDGLGRMLRWAQEQQIRAIYLPSGTYTVSKDGRIDLYANLLWELPEDATIKKETNGKEAYTVLSVGYGADNVTVKGGWYRGDRETHDYSGKDHPYSAGTHESGCGISIEGACNVTVEGVKATHFTGDGLIVRGAGQLGSDLYADHFESGGLNDAGAPVADAGKIRTRKTYPLTQPQFVDQGCFELSNWRNASAFEIYFYDDRQVFLSRTAAKERSRIDIPAGATQMRIVIGQPSAAGVYGEYWQRRPADDTTVRNSEFAYNRRQGITIGGGNRSLIENNRIHDNGGVDPMAGIDVEGGYAENGFWNSDITIRGNELWNNGRYDIILYDGRGATVEGNRLASKGAIGLAVAAGFSGGAVISNNRFDGTRIVAYHDAELRNNKMNDSYTTFEGPNLVIDGLDITNGTLNTSAKTDGAIQVSNVTIAITDNTKEAGLNVFGAGAAVFRNVTITGTSKLRSFVGGSAAANTFDRLRVLGYHPTYGLSLPAGTYADCEFVAAEGGQMGFVGISLPARYVFERTRFQTNSSGGPGVVVQKEGADVVIRDSQFDLLGNSQAVSVQQAARFVFERNVVNALKITSPATELIRINDYWSRLEDCDVLDVTISDNVINAAGPAIGIQTVYAGAQAPSYTVKNNTLNNAVLSLKANDSASGNIVRS